MSNKIEERSYKQDGYWFVYYVNENGDQLAPAGNSKTKKFARLSALWNIEREPYELPDYKEV